MPPDSEPFGIINSDTSAKSEPFAIIPKGSGKASKAEKSDDGFLSNAPDDTDAMSMAKGAGTAAIKALANIPGMFGNMEGAADALGSAVPAAWNAVTGNANFGQEYGRQLLKTQQAKDMMRDQQRDFMGFSLPSPPSASDISDPILAQTGEYKPTSTTGALTMAGVEGLGAAAVPGSAGTEAGLLAAQAPKAMPYIANLLSGAAGAAGTEGVMEMTHNPWLAGLSGLLTSMVPQWGAHLATARTEGTAQRMAGQAMRDASATPGDTQAALENLPTNAFGTLPPNLFGRGPRAPAPPETELTTAQASRDPGLAELEKAVKAKTGTSEGTFGGDIAERTVNSQAALETAAERAAKIAPNDPWSASQLASDNPAEGSVKARALFDKAESDADKTQSAAWQVPELQGLRMNKNRVLGKLTDALDTRMVADQQEIPPSFQKTLMSLGNTYRSDAQLPQEEIYRLYSNLKASVRDAMSGVQPDSNRARILGGLSSDVDKIILDPKNYSFAPKGSFQALKDARAATAGYYDTFKGTANDLLREPAGVAKVAPEATLNKVLSGDNAPQNVRIFRNAVGNNPQVDELLADHVVSDLTTHGTNLPHPDKIDEYMTRNAGTIKEVPGLESRLTDIKEQARGNVVSKGIRDNMEDPGKLHEWLNDNASDVNRVFQTPAQQNLIDAIKDTSLRLSKIPAGKMGSKETFNAIANGRIIDVLLGSASAKALGAASGVGMAELGRHLGMPEGMADSADYLLSALGAATHGTETDLPGKVGTSVLMGRNPERVMDMIQEGLKDPTVGAMLMKKADPDNINFLLQKVRPNISGTLPTLANSSKKDAAPYAKGGRVALDKSEALIKRVRSTFPLSR